MAIFLTTTGGLVLGPNGGIASAASEVVLDPPTAISSSAGDSFSIPDNTTDTSTITVFSLDAGDGDGTWSITADGFDPDAVELSASTGSSVNLNLSRDLTSGDITASLTVSVQYTGDTQGGGTLSKSVTIAVTDNTAEVELWSVDIDELESESGTDQPAYFGVPLGTSDWDPTTEVLKAYIGATQLHAQFAMVSSDKDGDGRSARVDFIMPTRTADTANTVVVKKAAGTQSAGTPITPEELATFINDNATGGDVRIAMTVSGTTYTASAKAFLDSDLTTYSAADPHLRGPWFTGPMASCYSGTVPFEDGSGNRTSDYLRAVYDVTGWKKADGTIVAVEVHAEIYNSAFDPASWGDVVWTSMVLEYGDGTDIEAYSSTSSSSDDPDRGVAYARSGFAFEDVYIGVSGAVKGGWEPAHETSSGRLQKVMDAKWAFDSYVPASAATSLIEGMETTLNSNPVNPFRSKGNHEKYNMGDTGARFEIGWLTHAQIYATLSYSATARFVIKRNAREALHIPWQYIDQDTGLYATKTRDGGLANATTDYTTTPSPNNTPWSPGPAHMPFDMALPYILFAKPWMVRAMHAQTLFIWLRANWGTGDGRRLFVADQDRGSAWRVRTVSLTIACTPNDVGAGLTGWSRSDMQEWFDAGAGTANDTELFGLYHGAKDSYWDASRTGAIPKSGWFDNDDPDNYRILYHGEDHPGRVWGMNYYAMAMALARKLNVGNADFDSLFDWFAEILPQYLGDSRWQWFMGLYTAAAPDFGDASYPLTKTEVFDHLASSLDVWAPAASHLVPVLITTMQTDFDTLGITGITPTWSSTDAVTLTLEGASAEDYFDGTASELVGRPVRLRGWAAAGADAIGFITSVTNSKTVVCDFQTNASAVDIDTGSHTSGTTINNGSTATDDQGRAYNTFYLPFPAEDAGWLSTTMLEQIGTAEYPSLVLAGLEAMADVGYHAANYEAWRDKCIDYEANRGRISDAEAFKTTGADAGDSSLEWRIKKVA